MKKRVFSMLASLAILFILLPVDAKASSTGSFSYVLGCDAPVYITSSTLINVDAGKRYNEVLENNLEKRRMWSDRNYSWTDPILYLEMDDLEMKTLSDEIVQDINRDYDKVRAIHNWVCGNVYYPTEGMEQGYLMGSLVFKNEDEIMQFINSTENLSTYERLITFKVGVCEYYSSIFSMLVRAQGIPCILVDGFASQNESRGIRHAWNEVYVDGRWTIVDTTWDSKNTYSNGKYHTGGIGDMYFDISDEEFAKTHEIEDYPDVDVNIDDGSPSTDITVNSSDNKLYVKGKEVSPNAYLIHGNNYFKLRDIAALLNGTDKQFAVSFDGATSCVTLTTGQPYSIAGGELTGSAAATATAQPSSNTIYVNGVKQSLTVYNINNSNYFKLRDLGKLVDFYVGYENGIVTISTDKGYKDVCCKG